MTRINCFEENICSFLARQRTSAEIQIHLQYLIIVLTFKYQDLHQRKNIRSEQVSLKVRRCAGGAPDNPATPARIFKIAAEVKNMSRYLCC